MKHFCFRNFVALTFLLWAGLFNANTQAQSFLLPVPGATSSTGPCVNINFSDNANPVITELPAHSFLYSNLPGDPHSETQLNATGPAIQNNGYNYRFEEVYLGQHPMFGQTVVHDADGNLLFFIVDNNIYNKRGEAMWDAAPNYEYPAHLLSNQVEAGANIFDGAFVMGPEFNRFSSNGVMLDPEICVFPIPGNCYKYGLAFSFFRHGAVAEASEVFYRTIEVIDENTVVMSEPVALTLHGISDDLAVGCDDYSTRATAVSKLRPDNSRILFVNFYNQIYLYSISPTTGDISYVNDFGFSEEYINLTSSNNPEMEVCEKTEGSNKYYYVATSLKGQLNASDSWARLYLYKINYYTHALEVYYSTPVPKTLSGTSTDQEEIKGIEFSPNGENIYITYYGQNALNYFDLGLSRSIISTGSQSPLLFQYSEIETGADGNLYLCSFDEASNTGSIARIVNPNNPGSASVQNNCFPSVNNLFLSFKSVYGGNYYSNSTKLLSFADQVDGEDYTSYYNTISNTCCANHLYYNEWPSATSFIQNPDWIWEPGVSNNPFLSNSGSVMIQSDVTVPAGKKLTLKNFELRFEENAKLILEPGATLELENSTLSTINKCDLNQKWPGVELRGNSLQSQLAPGAQAKIIMNNSTIENAVCGITTAEIDNNGYANYYTTGGIIQATNSHFVNCERSVQMLWYRNFHPTMQTTLNNLSYFKNCTYSVDDNIPPTLEPVDFVELYGVQGVRFMGCDFQDSRINPTTDRFDGIVSYDSKFSVRGLCLDPLSTQPCVNLQSSSFSFLKYAIVAESFNPLNNVTIDNCDFRSNYRAIRLMNMKSAVVTNNKFIVGNILNPLDQEAYGLYLEKSTGYSVFNNNFSSTAPDTYGCVVDNSGTSANVINNNVFSGLIIGVQTENTNGSTGMSVREFESVVVPFYNGLEVRCNVFDNTHVIDFAVASGAIKKYQGYCSSDSKTPAGNQFLTTSYYGNIYANTSAFPSENVFPFYYRYHNTPLTTPYMQLPTQSIVTPQTCMQNSFNFSTDCPLPSTPSIAIIQQVVANANNTLKGAFDLIDGGNTQALLDEINSTTSSAQLKNTLLDASPYLSDTVLIATISRTDQLSPGNLKEVLIPNSPLTAKVWKKVDELSIPRGIKMQISAAQTGVSDRALLEGEIAVALDSIAKYENILVDYYVNDTTGTGFESLINFYSTQPDIESQKLLTQAALAENNASLTQAVLTEIPQTSAQLIAFVDFYSFLNDLAVNNRTIAMITPSEKVFLQQIAESGTDVAFNAQLILLMLDTNRYIETIEELIFPEEAYLRGVVADNYLCGNNRVAGDSLAIVDASGNVVPFVSPAVTDDDGYFKFDANEIAYLDRNDTFSIKSLNGFALENVEYRTIQEWMDITPLNLVLAPVNKEWDALYSQQDSVGNTAIALDLNENLYVTGYSYTLSNGTEAHLLRYAPDGSQLWDVAYSYQGGTNIHSSIPADVATDKDGNIFVAINAMRTYYTRDIVVLKYDSIGHRLWEAVYPGVGLDAAVKIKTNKDGDAIVLVNSQNQIVLLKYKYSGSLTWNRVYSNSVGSELEIDDTGNIFISGTTSDTHPDQGFLVLQYSPDGDLRWAAENRKTSSTISSSGFALNNSGNIVAGGNTSNDAYYFMIDNTGHQIWENKVTGVKALALCTDSMGNIYCSNFENNTYRVEKLSPSGASLWTVPVYAPSGYTLASALKLSLGNDNSLYFGSTIVNPTESTNFFIGMIDNTANLVWTQRYSMNSLSSDFLADIQVSHNSNVYATGTTHYISDIGGGILMKRSMFATVKYSQCPLTSNLRAMEESNPAETPVSGLEFVKVYPNPSSGDVFVEYYLDGISTGEFMLYTTAGISVSEIHMQNGLHTITVNNELLAPGLYYFRAVANGEVVSSGKLLILE